jgi:hypothetical protein
MVPTRCLQEAAGIVTGSKGSTSGKGSNVGKGSTGSKGSKVSKGGTQVEDPQLAERLWRCGSLHIAVSAPRTAYGKWRLKFEPPVSSDFAGQVTCFTLEWVGNKVFHHECLRRAGSAGDPFIGPLIHLMMPFKFQQENVMRGLIHKENINEYERLRNYRLDEEQVGVIRRINASNRALFYIKASAGVGKTSVINLLLFSLSGGYEGTPNVVLVLVPNRELRHDICQDVASNVLKTENLLWLGRPPPGRPDGLWDDILDARLKDMQKETYANLDMIKNQLQLTLKNLMTYNHWVNRSGATSPRSSLPLLMLRPAPSHHSWR